jgi:hypothetical protein
MQFREVEFAALTGLILANEVDLLFNNDSMSAFRNQIYQELHDDIMHNYGTIETANRFGSLVCLLQDFDSISSEIEQCVTACKIFSPHKQELWD